MEILIYGIINSITLTLIALGFALVYGICRLPNFAHGAIYVVTGFIVWSALHTLGLHYLLSIFLALIISTLIGAAIYQLALIRVRGMPISEIIASYAIGLAILEGLRWAGFRGMTYTLPTFLEGTVDISDVPVDKQRLMVVIIGVMVLLLLWAFTHHTKIGLALRGMAQDERAA
ncbi:MAG: branched-chain amino acid ABC transporter permease, partial [Pseudomonadota bacterium]